MIVDPALGIGVWTIAFPRSPQEDTEPGDQTQDKAAGRRNIPFPVVFPEQAKSQDQKNHAGDQDPVQFPSSSGEQQAIPLQE